MKILLAGPFETEALRHSLGIEIAGAPRGTVQTPVTPLAAELKRLGHQVSLVTLDPTIVVPVSFEERGVSVTYCPLRGAPRYRARARSLDLFESEIRHLVRVMAAIAPDVVHAHWTYEYAEAAIRSDYPHVVTMHDLGWEYLLQWRDPYRLVRLIMKYRTVPRIRRLTVVAPFMAARSRAYGYLGPVAVIPNGIETPEVNMAAIRAKTKRNPIIVTVGNVGRIKNVRSSIEALKIIRLRHPAAELHLFGGGLDGTFVKGEEGVVPHGQVPHTELMEFLTEYCTVLVHPARLETFGVIISEAKARGVPVVAGKAARGTAFACGLNAGCVLVDVEKPNEIASSVLAFLASPAEYESSAIRALQDVTTRLSVGASARLYEKEYIRASTSI